MKQCPICDGKGKVWASWSATKLSTCPECKGKGTINPQTGR